MKVDLKIVNYVAKLFPSGRLSIILIAGKIDLRRLLTKTGTMELNQSINWPFGQEAPIKANVTTQSINQSTEHRPCCPQQARRWLADWFID